MTTTVHANLERRVMHVLLTCLLLFAVWTLLHQLSTFGGVSWRRLELLTAWLALPVAIGAFLLSGRLATMYAGHLPEPVDLRGQAGSLRALLMLPVVAGVFFLFESYATRYALLLAGFGVLVLWGLRASVFSGDRAESHMAGAASSSWPDAVALWLLMAATVLVVLCANRSDFDDAEYIQSAIQTLRYPDRAIFTFDASLGTVLEQFRFAPYRLTSYETFVGLLAQATGLGILDVYYLLVPGVAAALSVMVAFVFLRWFLPARWAIVAVSLFLLIVMAWGETHVAFGNRMYVRLFQGKGWLVAITTPVTIIMALLWMRLPRWQTWLGLLCMQILAIGASSSGLVVTCFATAVGLASGFLARPSRSNVVGVGLGGITLAYPLVLGLWLKYASSVSGGVVEEIGSYLPINASFGGLPREALALTIFFMVCFLLLRSVARSPSRAVDGGRSGAIAARTAFWLVVCSFVLVLNPVLISYITNATSKNMNWRLAWAAPIPLLLALGMVMLLRASSPVRPFKGFAVLSVAGAVVACGAFFLAGPWTLASSNGVTWGWAERKLPPEYHQAVMLAKRIRELGDGKTVSTVMVEPRVGTWMTVVAPDFKLIMPGHGYWVTLKTIMDPTDFQRRNQLLTKIDAITAGDTSLVPLLDAYGVNVVVSKPGPGTTLEDYRILTRTAAEVRPTS